MVTKEQAIAELNRRNSSSQLGVTKEQALAELKRRGVPDPQAEDGLARTVGLGARGVLQGVASPITMGSDLVTAGIGALTDKDITPLSQIVSQGLTDVGLPEPRTAGERVGVDVAGGIGGGASVGKGLVQRAIGAASGASGGAASGTAREMGASIPAQIGAGVIGGGLTSSALMRPQVTTSTSPLMKDISEKGIDEVSAFSNLRGSIQKEAQRQREKTNQLFDSAKKLGDTSFITGDAKQKLIQSVNNLKQGEIDEEAINLFDSFIKRIDDLGDDIKVNDLESIRRSVSRISRTGGGKGYGGGKLTSTIDEVLEDADNLIGNKDSGRLWNKAIKQRREFGNRFERPSEIAKALGEETNETIERVFIGSGGASLNKEMGRVYENVIKSLPSDQKRVAGFQMRQSVINRMVKNAIQSVDGEDVLSAQRLSNQIRNFRKENQSMWSKFTESEKSMLNKLSVDLNKATKGGVLNKVYNGLEKIISKALGSNVQLPRTLKPKTLVTVDDLIDLTNIKPKTKIPSLQNTAKATVPGGLSSSLAINQEIPIEP